MYIYIIMPTVLCAFFLLIGGRKLQVRLATDMDGDRLVALKILKKEWIWKNDMSALVRREIEIMKGMPRFRCVTALL